MKFLKSKKGFSLAELMIVVAILAILVAVAVPAFRKVSDTKRVEDCYMNRQMISFTVQEAMNGMLDNGKKQDIILMELAKSEHVTLSPGNFPLEYANKKCFMLTYDEMTAFTLGDIRGGYRVVSSYDVGCQQGNYLKRADLADVKFYTKLANGEIPQCAFEEPNEEEYHYYIFEDATVICDCPECLEAMK